MPLKDFAGKTFVAFIDISGFKKKLQKDKEEAIKTLSLFFNEGYKVLNHNKDVSGLFISDCGILYANKKDDNNQTKLKKLLNVIKEININLIKKDIILTTNIAYGDFIYKNKIELGNLEKNLMTGNAYVEAYLDSSKMKKVTHCRIVDNPIFTDFDITKLHGYIIEKEDTYYYYYWQCKDQTDLTDFKEKFNSINNEDSKFKRLQDFTKKRIVL